MLLNEREVAVAGFEPVDTAKGALSAPLHARPATLLQYLIAGCRREL
jgi:hypothetical protein